MNFHTSLKERASYGAFFLGQNIIYMLMLQFLNLFYTDVLGIGAAAVGILFFIARTWDAVNDPILGSIVDRANFKGGKFLPWIKTVNIILPLSTALLFFNPDWSGTGNLAYAYATYILWGMIYTLCDVPIFALSTAMTKNTHERVVILTWGRVAALIGALIIAGGTMPLVDKYGWTQVVSVFCCIAFIVMLPIRFLAVERVKRVEQQSVSLSSSFSYLRNHRPMLIFYLATMVAAGTNTTMVACNYFAIYNLGGGESKWVAPLMLAQMVPMFVLAPMLPVLIHRFGKKAIFIWGSLFSAFFGVLQWIIGYQSIPVVMVLQMLKSVGVFLPILLLGMFSADFVEYGHYKQKKRLEGVAFSIQTFATKLTTAVAAGLGGILLGRFGYVANSAQTSQTLYGIFYLYTLLPVFGTVVSAWIMHRYYDLPEARVQQMIDAMNLQAADPLASDLDMGAAPETVSAG